MAIFLEYGPQDGAYLPPLFGDRPNIYDENPTTSTKAAASNRTLCASCRALELKDLVALKASVGVYLPYVSRESLPLRNRIRQRIETLNFGGLTCALCALCRTDGVGYLIRKKEALDECTVKRKTLLTAIGISSRPPEKEFEQLAIKLRLGRPRTTGIAAEYGSYASEFIERRTITDPLSPASRQRLTGWISECRDSHPTCRQTISGTEIESLPKLPTRVIDVGCSDDKYALRLFVTDGHHAEYLTLSHCWGNNSHAVLTKASLPALERTMTIAGLPLTIQHAIITTRVLGFRYLWIDSVCIMQDSAKDWDHESQQMGSIYELSFCTIAATCASDSASGFLKPRSHNVVRLKANKNKHLPHKENMYFRLKADDNKYLPDHGYMYFTNQPTSDPHYIEEAKLNTRGWVLQERLLSRRIIHFAEDQIYWECRHHIAAEDGLLEPTMRPRQDQLTGITRLLSERPSPESFISLWLDIIERHSQLNFTFEKDRLPALLGLKERLAGLTSLSYIDGHWFPAPGSPIPRSLLFYVHGKEGVHCAQSDCPSWSWEGKGSAVTYEATVGLARATYLRMEERALVIRGHVVRARVDPDEDTAASRIRDVYCDVNVMTPPNSRVSKGYQDYADPVGHVKFDSVTHMPLGFECLWVFTHVGGSNMFLALEEMDASEGHSSSYRRVGMGSFPRSVSLKLGQETEIRIV